jgi:DNA-binding YbaB/EbfC family protein
MQTLQGELDSLEVQGISGGGLLTVTMTGKSELKGVSIDPSLLKPDEKEILEDLLVAAHADAKRKAEALLQDKMKDLTGGLPIPPGLKLF